MCLSYTNHNSWHVLFMSESLVQLLCVMFWINESFIFSACILLQNAFSSQGRRQKNKQTPTSRSPQRPFAISPSLSNMAPRETNEKSWIPNVSGLLRQQEIFLKICLNVKPVIQTKGILKSTLKSLGLDGFVFLGYIKQALDLAPHGN